MATDPQTLLSQASCYACFMENEDLMTLALLAMWTGNATVPNLIPPGTTYNGGGVFTTLTLVVGVTYNVMIKSPNDQHFTNGGFTDGTQDVLQRFTATITNCVFQGIANSAVTAIIYPVTIMATDPQTLFSQANCYACYTTGTNQSMLMQLAMLSQIVKAKSPTTATDPATLLAAAACYACYTPQEMRLMELALLAQIVALGC